MKMCPKFFMQCTQKNLCYKYTRHNYQEDPPTQNDFNKILQTDKSHCYQNVIKYNHFLS